MLEVNALEWSTLVLLMFLATGSRGELHLPADREGGMEVRPYTGTVPGTILLEAVDWRDGGPTIHRDSFRYYTSGGCRLEVRSLVNSKLEYWRYYWRLLF